MYPSLIIDGNSCTVSINDYSNEEPIVALTSDDIHMGFACLMDIIASLKDQYINGYNQGYDDCFTDFMNES